MCPGAAQRGCAEWPEPMVATPPEAGQPVPTEIGHAAGTFRGGVAWPARFPRASGLQQWAWRARPSAASESYGGGPPANESRFRSNRIGAVIARSPKGDEAIQRSVLRPLDSLRLQLRINFAGNRLQPCASRPVGSRWALIWINRDCSGVYNLSRGLAARVVPPLADAKPHTRVNEEGKILWALR